LDSGFSHQLWRIDSNIGNYRFFRVIQTGKNSFVATKTGDKWSHVFVVSGFELYGAFQVLSTLSKGIIEETRGRLNIGIQASGVGRGNVDDFIAKNQVQFWTTNRAMSWIAIDFGENVALSPTAYRVRYSSGGNFCCPRNWLLQGTNNVLHAFKNNTNGGLDPRTDPNWDTLSIHVNDSALDAEFYSHLWNLPETGRSYRIFRVIQTDKNKYSTNTQWCDVLVMGGFEIWGTLTVAPKQDSEKIIA